MGLLWVALWEWVEWEIWAGVGGLTQVTTERSVGSGSGSLSWWVACGSQGCIWGLSTIGRACLLRCSKVLMRLVAFLLWGVVG